MVMNDACNLADTETKRTDLENYEHVEIAVLGMSRESIETKKITTTH